MLCLYDFTRPESCFITSTILKVSLLTKWLKNKKDVSEVNNDQVKWSTGILEKNSNYKIIYKCVEGQHYV